MMNTQDFKRYQEATLQLIHTADDLSDTLKHSVCKDLVLGPERAIKESDTFGAMKCFNESIDLMISFLSDYKAMVNDVYEKNKESV